jgi:hypothetical protein
LPLVDLRSKIGKTTMTALRVVIAAGVAAVLIQTVGLTPTEPGARSIGRGSVCCTTRRGRWPSDCTPHTACSRALPTFSPSG